MASDYQIVTLFLFTELCEKVIVAEDGKSNVKDKFPFIFTSYRIHHQDSGHHVTYISEDGRYAIAFCDGIWVIQKAKYINQKPKRCWKFAFTEEDGQRPTDTGFTWKYKNKIGANEVTWPDAGMGLSVTCAPIDCKWSDWAASGPCSKECGGGIQQLSRVQTQVAMYAGRACSGDFTATQPCNDFPCPINCMWSNWGEWGTCSRRCGGGTQWQFRSISQAAAHGGKGCSGSFVMKRPCNRKPCPTEGEDSNLIKKQIDDLKGTLVTHIQNEIDNDRSSLESKIESQLNQLEDSLRDDMNRINDQLKKDDFKIKALCQFANLFFHPLYNVCQDGFDSEQFAGFGTGTAGFDTGRDSNS